MPTYPFPNGGGGFTPGNSADGKGSMPSPGSVPPNVFYDPPAPGRPIIDPPRPGYGRPGYGRPDGRGGMYDVKGVPPAPPRFPMGPDGPPQFFGGPPPGFPRGVALPPLPLGAEFGTPINGDSVGPPPGFNGGVPLPLGVDANGVPTYGTDPYTGKPIYTYPGGPTYSNFLQGSGPGASGTTITSAGGPQGPRPQTQPMNPNQRFMERNQPRPIGQMPIPKPGNAVYGQQPQRGPADRNLVPMMAQGLGGMIK
jgi:protein LSM14